MSFLQTFRTWVSSRWAIAIFDPLGPFVLLLLLLALATAAVVSTSGCGELFPLLPTANVESVEPGRVAPDTTFEVNVAVTPDVSSCVLTVFGERSTCRTETNGCRCSRQAPLGVGGAFVLEVTAATSAGIASAKSTVVVDGAPPTIDSARVFVVRNPLGIKDAIVGDVGSVVDRPVNETSGALIDVFASDSGDGEALASFAINGDGSFGPIDLKGTETGSPGRVFVVVTDLLGNESAPTEVVDARDDAPPNVVPSSLAMRRTPIGSFDQVHIGGSFVANDDGCAMATHTLFSLDMDPSVDTPLTEVPVQIGRESFVDVGGLSESFSTLVVVTADKCGNETLPVVIDVGVDADLPTIDLRIIDAKRMDGAVHVVGGVQSVFDDTSAIRSVEVYIDDVFRHAATPEPNGAFEATVQLEPNETVERVSFLVVDKTGWRTLRVRLSALTTSTGAQGVGIREGGSDVPADQMIAPEILERTRGNAVAFDVLASVDGVVAETTGAGSQSGGYVEVDVIERPISRIFVASAFDPITNAMVVVGGSTATQPALADSWRFVDDEWSAIWGDPTRSPPPDNETVAPGPRRRAQMAFDPMREAVLLFGGEGEGDSRVLLSDTWSLDADGWHALNVASSPPPRASASMVTDLVNQKTLLIGGECFSGECEDIWEWDGTTWTPHSICDSGEGAPSGRVGAQVAFDPTTGNIVLFGGRRGGVRLDDTWVLDDTGWHERQIPIRPSPRAGGALFFDPSLRLLLMHGGEGSNDPDDQFWAFVDGMWVTLSLPNDPPPQRAWGATVTGETPVIGFGVSSRASIFAPQNDIWRGVGQAQAGGFARFTIGLTSEFARDEVDNAVVTIHGGGSSDEVDGYSVFARAEGEPMFERVGLAGASSSALAPTAFPIASRFIHDDGSIQLVIDSRGRTTNDVVATMTVDAIAVDWRIFTGD